MLDTKKTDTDLELELYIEPQNEVKDRSSIEAGTSKRDMDDGEDSNEDEKGGKCLYLEFFQTVCFATLCHECI